MIEEANIEQITKNEVEQTTGINPEVIPPSNESSISPITKIDPISLYHRGDNNQREEAFSPAGERKTNKRGANKGEANTSIGDEWHRIIAEKGKIEIPL